MKRERGLILLFVLILGLSAAMRFTGLNWDDGVHLHPDERFLAMVIASIQIPHTFSEYFDTATSQLNPHNVGHSFFVYGTFPLFLAKGIAVLLGRSDYGPFLTLGRGFAAVFDFASILLVFWMGRRILGLRAAVLAAALYAFAPLTVQHAQFFVVDPVLSMLALLTLALALERKSAAFGLCYGLAMASKLTALPLFFLLPLSFLLENPRRPIRAWGPKLLLAGLISLLTFRVFQPYAFQGPGFFNLVPNPKWIANLRELASYSKYGQGFPPGVQWIDRGPLFAPLNFAFFGFTLPASAAAVYGIFLAFRSRKEAPALFVIAAWTFAYGIWQSMGGNPTLRYLLPIYGTAAILAAHALLQIRNLSFRRVGIAVAFFSSLAGGLGIAASHHLTHTRIEASNYLFKTIPAPIRIEPSQAVATIREDGPFSETRVFTVDLENPPGSPPIESIHFARVESIGQDPAPIRTPLGKSSPPVFELTLRSSSGKVFWNGTSPAKEQPVQEVVFEIGKISVPEPGPIHVELKAQLGSSGEFRVTRPGIAHETSWDDGLPLGLPNHPPYEALYAPGLNLELFQEDGPEKAQKIAVTLDRADWIVSSSQRVWGSVGRLPKLYPMTQIFLRELAGCENGEEVPACYRAIARGEKREGRLGFRLERSFLSFLPDLRAEEAFTVYDHPPVLIFKKTDEFAGSKILEALVPAFTSPKEPKPQQGP